MQLALAELKVAPVLVTAYNLITRLHEHEIQVKNLKKNENQLLSRGPTLKLLNLKWQCQADVRLSKVVRGKETGLAPSPSRLPVFLAGLGSRPRASPLPSSLPVELFWAGVGASNHPQSQARLKKHTATRCI